MKRILSLVLALSMVLSMFSFSFAGTFADLEGTNYEAAASALFELSITKGKTEDSFGAEDAVRRSEMAAFLVRASGLEDAASVSKGATSFSDVEANHWASGYINVATQYGLINGYPDGTFAPDAEVSYAEAVTMAIRALGYKTVVEAKGTWPTNYIAKAQELDVIDGIKYDLYTDAAIRGDIALLVWNTLTTEMWDVKSENENTGLNYEKSSLTMIDKYFEDYLYIDEDDEAVVTAIAIVEGEESNDVVITLDTNKVDLDGDYKLARDIDFLDLVGRTVSVLYNKEDEVAVMVVPSNNDQVKEGYFSELSGDGYTVSGDALVEEWGSISGDHYASAVIGSRKVFNAITRFDATTTFIVSEVEKVKEAYDVTLIDETIESIPEDAIVLIDGKWATGADLEENDIVTELETDKLYIVSRDTVTGKFDNVTKEKDSENDEYYITVDSKDYDVATGVDSVVEVDEKGKETTTTLEEIRGTKAGESKFLGEKCLVYFNYLGEVVRIEFSEVDTANEGEFYVLTYINSVTGRPYYTTGGKNSDTMIELNGEDYVVDIDSGDKLVTLGSGEVVYVEFNKNDETILTQQVASGDSFAGYKFYDVVSGDHSGDELLDDYNRIVGKYKATSSTIVYTITEIVKEDDETIVERYEVDITKGLDALKGVDAGIVAFESGDSFKKAAYVFTWKSARNTEKTFGLVKAASESSKDGVQIKIDDVLYEIEASLATVEGYVGDLVAYIENDGEVEISKLFKMSDILAVSGDRRVEDIDGSLINFVSGDDWDTDVMVDSTHKDHTVVLVNAKKDADGKYYFASYNATHTIEDLETIIRVDDVVVESESTDKVDVVVIIRGLK